MEVLRGERGCLNAPRTSAFRELPPGAYATPLPTPCKTYMYTTVSAEFRPPAAVPFRGRFPSPLIVAVDPRGLPASAGLRHARGRVFRPFRFREQSGQDHHDGPDARADE